MAMDHIVVTSTKAANTHQDNDAIARGRMNGRKKRNRRQQEANGEASISLNRKNSGASNDNNNNNNNNSNYYNNNNNNNINNNNYYNNNDNNDDAGTNRKINVNGNSILSNGSLTGFSRRGPSANTEGSQHDLQQNASVGRLQRGQHHSLPLRSSNGTSGLRTEQKPSLVRGQPSGSEIATGQQQQHLSSASYAAADNGHRDRDESKRGQGGSNGARSSSGAQQPARGRGNWTPFQHQPQPQPQPQSLSSGWGRGGRLVAMSPAGRAAMAPLADATTAAQPIPEPSKPTHPIPVLLSKVSSSASAPRPSDSVEAAAAPAAAAHHQTAPSASSRASEMAPAGSAQTTRRRAEERPMTDSRLPTTNNSHSGEHSKAALASVSAVAGAAAAAATASRPQNNFNKMKPHIGTGNYHAHASMHHETQHVASSNSTVATGSGSRKQNSNAYANSNGHSNVVDLATGGAQVKSGMYNNSNNHIGFGNSGVAVHNGNHAHGDVHVSAKATANGIENGESYGGNMSGSVRKQGFDPSTGHQKQPVPPPTHGYPAALNISPQTPYLNQMPNRQLPHSATGSAFPMLPQSSDAYPRNSFANNYYVSDPSPTAAPPAQQYFGANFNGAPQPPHGQIYAQQPKPAPLPSPSIPTSASSITTQQSTASFASLHGAPNPAAQDFAFAAVGFSSNDPQKPQPQQSKPIAIRITRDQNGQPLKKEDLRSNRVVISVDAGKQAHEALDSDSAKVPAASVVKALPTSEPSSAIRVSTFLPSANANAAKQTQLQTSKVVLSATPDSGKAVPALVTETSPAQEDTTEAKMPPQRARSRSPRARSPKREKKEINTATLQVDVKTSDVAETIAPAVASESSAASIAPSQARSQPESASTQPIAKQELAVPAASAEATEPPKEAQAPTTAKAPASTTTQSSDAGKNTPLVSPPPTQAKVQNLPQGQQTRSRLVSPQDEGNAQTGPTAAAKSASANNAGKKASSEPLEDGEIPSSDACEKEQLAVYTVQFLRELRGVNSVCPPINMNVFVRNSSRNDDGGRGGSRDFGDHAGSGGRNRHGGGHGSSGGRRDNQSHMFGVGPGIGGTGSNVQATSQIPSTKFLSGTQGMRGQDLLRTQSSNAMAIARGTGVPRLGAGPNRIMNSSWLRSSSGAAQNLSELRKSNAPPRQRSEFLMAGVDANDEEQVALREIELQATSALNKITESNFEAATSFFAQTFRDTKTVTHIAHLISAKAFEEPKFSYLYARLVLKMYNVSKPLTNPPADGKTTGTIVLEAVFRDCRAAVLNRPHWNVKDIGQLTELEYEEQVKVKNKCLGNVRYIGELFELGVLPESLFSSLIAHMLYPEPEPKEIGFIEENLECAVTLLRSAGPEVDRRGCDIEKWFKTLEAYSVDKRLCSRIRFMLLDIIAFHENNWMAPTGSFLKNQMTQAENASRGGGKGFSTVRGSQSSSTRTSSLVYTPRSSGQGFGGAAQGSSARNAGGPGAPGLGSGGKQSRANALVNNSFGLLGDQDPNASESEGGALGEDSEVEEEGKDKDEEEQEEEEEVQGGDEDYMLPEEHETKISEVYRELRKGRESYNGVAEVLHAAFQAARAAGGAGIIAVLAVVLQSLAECKEAEACEHNECLLLVIEEGKSLKVADLIGGKLNADAVQNMVDDVCTDCPYINRVIRHFVDKLEERKLASESEASELAQLLQAS